MKRLDVVLSVAGVAILGVWSWRTWPDPVTAAGVTAVAVPAYVALVWLLVRVETIWRWMLQMHSWAEAIEGNFGATSGEQLAVSEPPTDEIPEQHPDPTEPLERVIEANAQQIIAEDRRPTPQPRGATAVSALAEDDWRARFSFRDNSAAVTPPTDS